MKICVIGGGAAGCMAAGAAAEAGAEVTLLEKNEKLLKKMFITGKGRCNLTNYVDGEEFLRHVVTNARFLYSSLFAFDSFAVYDLFENRLRVPLKVERGERVFPVSDKSSDLTRALEGYVRDSGVKVCLNAAFSGLRREAGGWEVAGVGRFDRAIVATGGKSYPATGSTGDGYTLAASLGHTIVPPVPALVGIDTRETYVSSLSGLTLKNIGLKCEAGGKTIYEERGELLFTHTGVSGPLALSLSSRINRLDLSDVSLAIDLKPALSAEELDERVRRDFSECGKKAFKNSLGGLLPKSLIPVVVRLAAVAPDKPVSRITAEERGRLVSLLKGLRLKPKSLRPLAEAIVTAGGVSVKEVDPKTMESKLAPGVHFAGEVLDVDALTGGFNLQIAFSTGRAAGVAAAGKR